MKNHFSIRAWAVSAPFLLAAFLRLALFAWHNLTGAGTQGLLTWASHLIEIGLKHNDSKIVFVNRARLEIPEQGERQGNNILATPLTISMGNPFRLKVLVFSWPRWGLLKIKLEYTKIWSESNSSIRQMKTRGRAVHQAAYRESIHHRTEKALWKGTLDSLNSDLCLSLIISAKSLWWCNKSPVGYFWMGELKIHFVYKGIQDLGAILAKRSSVELFKWVLWQNGWFWGRAAFTPVTSVDPMAAFQHPPWWFVLFKLKSLYLK